MNDIQIFNNPEFGEIRTIEENGVPLFCGSDVARALGYGEPHKAVSRHCKGGTKHPILTNGGNQEMLFIPESDLYRLVFSSKLPTAEKFTDWVTSEVLPSIRKTGKFSDRSQRELDPEAVIRCAEIMSTCRPENRVYVLQILKTILPKIELDERILCEAFSEPRGDLAAGFRKIDAEGCLVDSLGRRQPPRGGCKEPFDHLKFYNLCISKNIRDTQLAGEIGCTFAQVYKWRNGISKPTSFYRVRLCNFFGVPEDYFTPKREGGKNDWRKHQTDSD